MENNHKVIIDEFLERLNISNTDMVKASSDQLTFKMIKKARKGKPVTTNVQDKILQALLAIKPDLKVKRRDLFQYQPDVDLSEKVKQLIVQSMDKKISYPAFIDQLLLLGVIAYEADLRAKVYRFFWTSGQCCEYVAGAAQNKKPGIYDQKSLLKAIASIQKQTIDHDTFLNDIYEAGVVRYEVNTRHRYIRYQSEMSSYREDIPTTQEFLESSKKEIVQKSENKTTEKTNSIKKKKTKAKSIKNKRIGMTRKQRKTISKVLHRKRRR